MRNPLNNLVDRVYVLTLAMYPRRKEKMRHHLAEECGMNEEAIVFFEGKTGGVPLPVDCHEDRELSILDFLLLRPVLSDDVSKNITQNHIQMIREAYQSLSDPKGWVLFLEDDCRVDKTRFSNEQSDWIKYFLEKEQPDILLLGCLPFFYKSPLMASVYTRPYIVRHFSITLTAHSYILTRRGMEKFLQFIDTTSPLPDHCRFDHLFYLANLTVYSTCPMICFQNRDPALYRRFQSMMPLFQMLTFRQVSDLMMHLSIFFPPVVIACLLVSVVYLIQQTVRTLSRHKKG